MLFKKSRQQISILPHGKPYRYYNIVILIFFLWLLFQGCTVKPYSNLRDIQYIEGKKFLLEFGQIFIPETVINIYRLRDFISSKYFETFKSLKGDISAIDEMYNYALYLSDGDILQSLFFISLATLPYKSTPAKIPIIKADLMFYFSFESDSAFHLRLKNLPSHIFYDSPKNNFGDKDKIPHFFGAAFLTYETDTKFVAELTGEIIEFGESILQLEGFSDERDKKVNSLGSEFGKLLIRNPELKPSEVLKKYK